MRMYSLRLEYFFRLRIDRIRFDFLKYFPYFWNKF